MAIKSTTARSRGTKRDVHGGTYASLLCLFSIIAQPSLDQSSILLRDDTRRSYLLGSLKPNAKYRVQVRARTSVGLSTRPAIIELTTNLTLGKQRTQAGRINQRCPSFYILLVPSKPTFTVTHRGTTFFNVSFDPTIMTVPGSLYYIDYRENDNGAYLSRGVSICRSHGSSLLCFRSRTSGREEVVRRVERSNHSRQWTRAR